MTLFVTCSLSSHFRKNFEHDTNINNYIHRMCVFNFPSHNLVVHVKMWKWEYFLKMNKMCSKLASEVRVMFLYHYYLFWNKMYKNK